MNDDPTGASPWGSSPQASPQHNRTGFSSASSEVTSSSPYQDAPTSNGSYSNIAQDYNRAESSVAESVTDSSVGRPSTAGSVAEPVRQQQQSTPVHHPGQQAQQTTDQRQQPSRQQSRQGPQYRLQAKITGLERTGRKDPVLRFDVYVCLLFSNSMPPLIESDKSTFLSNHTIPRCTANTFRICQVARASDIIESRGHSPCCTTCLDIGWRWDG